MRATIGLCCAMLSATACAPRLGPPRVEHGATATVLPIVQLRADRSRWYVVADMGPLGERVWFLDTGYAFTTCDDGLVTDLKLPTRGRTAVRGEGGKVLATRARLPDYTLGEHQITGHTCAVRDLHTTSSIRDSPDVAIAGVMGMDLLRRFRVVIDPSTSQVELHADAQPALDRRHDQVLRLRRDHPFGLRVTVPISVDGLVLRPLLDTGATRSMLDTRGLDRDPDRVQRDAKVRATGATRTMDLHWYTVQVELAGLPLGPLEVIERAAHGDGLLGVDVLSKVRATLDLAHGRALFEPVTPARPPTYERYDRARNARPSP